MPTSSPSDASKLVAQIEAELLQEQKEFAADSERLERLVGNVKTMSTELPILSQANQEMSKKLSALEKDAQSQKTELEQAQRDVTGLKKSNDTLTKTNKAMTARYMVQSSQIPQLQEQIQDQQKKIAAYKKSEELAFKKLQDKYKSAETALSAMRSPAPTPSPPQRCPTGFVRNSKGACISSPSPPPHKAGSHPSPSPHKAGSQPSPSPRKAGSQPSPSLHKAGSQPSPSPHKARAQAKATARPECTSSSQCDTSYVCRSGKCVLSTVVPMPSGGPAAKHASYSPPASGGAPSSQWSCMIQGGMEVCVRKAAARH